MNQNDRRGMPETLSGVAVFVAAAVVAAGFVAPAVAQRAPLYTTRSTVEVSAPGVFVAGYPMLVTITFTNNDSHYPDGGAPLEFFEPLLGLSSRHVGGRGVWFHMQSTSGAELQIGPAGGPYRDFDPGRFIGRDPRVEGLPKPRSISPGETFTTTLDLLQVVASANPRGKYWSRLPGVGVWDIHCETGIKPIQEVVPEVEVREATPEETTVAIAISGGLPLERSWFPDAFLSSEPLPDSRELPLPTRRIVEMIAVIRAALASPQAGLAAIDDRADLDWGHLTHLITAVEYECSIQTQSRARAEVARKRIVGKATHALELKLIDEGEGLISRLREDQRPGSRGF
jgi:hypothetical protein